MTVDMSACARVSRSDAVRAARRSADSLNGAPSMSSIVSTRCADAAGNARGMEMRPGRCPAVPSI